MEYSVAVRKTMNPWVKNGRISLVRYHLNKNQIEALKLYMDLYMEFKIIIENYHESLLTNKLLHKQINDA
jgi:hypothetical protein